jgi:hypothetical protein
MTGECKDCGCQGHHADVCRDVGLSAVDSVVIPPEVIDFARFMAKTWCDITSAIDISDGEALMFYPQIQGTANQMKLRRIAARSFDHTKLAAAADWLAKEHSKKGAAESSREPACSISGFNYVDVVGEGCEGWINLFFGDNIIALVKDVSVADSIKAVIEPRRK